MYVKMVVDNDIESARQNASTLIKKPYETFYGPRSNVIICFRNLLQECFSVFLEAGPKYVSICFE